MQRRPYAWQAQVRLETGERGRISRGCGKLQRGINLTTYQVHLPTLLRVATISLEMESRLHCSVER